MEVIDLLSDEEDHSSTGNRNEDSIAVLQVMRGVLPHLNDSQLSALLDQAGQDVERAVNLGLQPPSRRPMLQQTKPARRALFQPRDRTSVETGRDDSETTTEPTLSHAWHRTIERMSSLGVWKDPDFPPISTSIDGRSRQTSTEVIMCPCGYPAVSKKVQSDGPNYGRFYLACGRPQKRRAPTMSVRESPKRTLTDPVKVEDHQKSPNATKKTIQNPYAKRKDPPASPENTIVPKLSSSPQRRYCNFFQWDTKGGASNAYLRSSKKFSWKHFDSQSYVLYKRQFSHSSVRQGAVGNCWFLSALAVVAEKPSLIQSIVPHRSLNACGCYQVNLFLDGAWTPVLVDAFLPTVENPRTVTTTAFCDVFEGQLWAPIVEKAYAKAHGSYQQLSGGFIQEALQDLTGAPTETVIFQAGYFDREEFWARLESFASAGFLMGVATAQGGDGLVGMHAYSILEVLTLDNCTVGQQAKVTEYFGKTKRPRVAEKTTVRLVRIRNPWGKREWKGAWSADSEQWTSTIRSRLGSASTYAKGDGTFYISYDDMLQRFHHLDVAKTMQGWVHSISDGIFGVQNDPLASSRFAYFFGGLNQTATATISVIQPKKRAHTESSSWYCDPSFIVMKGTSEGSWAREVCFIAGITRQSHIDIMVEAGMEYCCIPFSCVAGSSHDVRFPFRLVVYASAFIQISTKENTDKELQGKALKALHQELLSQNLKLLYPVYPKALLACIHCQNCVIFTAMNGFTDQILSIKVMVDLPKGLLRTFGDEESDLPPQSQAICLVVSTNGRQSAASEFSFRYVSTLTPSRTTSTDTGHPRHRLDSQLSLSIAGDLTTASIDPSACQAAGGDRIDTYMWIPQLGAATAYC